MLKCVFVIFSSTLSCFYKSKSLFFNPLVLLLFFFCFFSALSFFIFLSLWESNKPTHDLLSGNIAANKLRKYFIFYLFSFLLPAVFKAEQKKKIRNSWMVIINSKRIFSRYRDPDNIERQDELSGRRRLLLRLSEVF